MHILFLYFFIGVTGEDTNLETSYEEQSPISKSVPSTILKQPIQNTCSNVLKQQSVLNTTKIPKKSKKVLCYVIQHPEKENVNAIPSMVPKNYKTNPRSVLKQSAIEVSLAGKSNLKLIYPTSHIAGSVSNLD